MNLQSKYLNSSLEANQFFNMAEIPSGVKALLGDYENLDPMVKADVHGAHLELQNAVGKIRALVTDPTRPSLPEKHAAGEVVANKTVASLQRRHDTLVKTADALHRDALREADSEFAPRVDTNALDAEQRAWMRETLKTEGGLQRVKEAIKSSDSAARAFYHSPAYLVGFQPDQHLEMKMEVLAARRPAIYEKLSSSLAIEKVASRFQETIKRIPAAFYNPKLAEAANTRVEV
jgi:hypothetical protein